MEELRGLLQNPKEFEDVFIDILKLDRWEVVDEKLKGIDQLVGDFFQHQWIKDNLAQYRLNDPPPAVIFVLFTMEIWRQEYNRVGKKKIFAIPLLFSFARYFLPAYQLLVDHAFDKKLVVETDEDARKWLATLGKLRKALRILDVNLNDSLLAELNVRLTRDPSTFSKARKKGMSFIHKSFCKAFGIRVQDQGEEQVEAGTEKKVGVTSDEQDTKNLDRGTKEAIATLFPPFFHPYWESDELVAIADSLIHQFNHTPKLFQIFDTFILNKLTVLSLSSDHRLLARELLSYLPYWAMIDKSQPPPCINRRRLEEIWKEFHQESISGLITNLLDAGLLSLENDGDFRIKNISLYEYMLSSTFLRESKDNFDVLPPIGSSIPLSRWLCLQMNQLFKAGDCQRAGERAWMIQGFLPGCYSYSWEQIPYILSTAPDVALAEPHIWALGRIAQKIFETVGLRNEKPSHNSLLDQFFARIPNEPQGEESKYFQMMADRYLGGLFEFLEWREHLEDPSPGHYLYHMGQVRDDVSRPGGKSFSWGPSYVPDRVDEIDWMYRHMVSAVRLFDPLIELDPVFTWDKERKLLGEYYQHGFFQSGDNPLSKVIYAEPLVVWGFQGIDQILEEYDTKKYLIGNTTYQREWHIHNRFKILWYALAFIPGYEDWV